MVTLKPPGLFGIVEEGIYRSQSPLEENLPFLARLNLRTVLHLSPEVLLRGVVDWLDEKKVTVHNLGLQAWKPEPGWTPLSDEFIKDALEMMLDSRFHPVLVCCTSGSYQTGPLVGCLRRVQNWSLTSILDEYRAFAGVKARPVHEQYVELYDTDLVTVPQQAPAWFVDYNLIDPRTEERERELLSQELVELECRLADSVDDEGSEELMVLARRKRLELRLIEQAYSTQLVSPGTRWSKASICDDEDDD